MQQEELPLALRRERRSNFGVRPKWQQQQPMETPQVRTPKRSSKKKVRHSDPGVSGLTPFLRRSSLLCTNPSRRRTSTLFRLHDAVSPVPTPDSLRRVQDGRVERRQRRDTVRAALEKLGAAHNKDNTAAKAQIEELKVQLKTRDREIYELQNATIVVDTSRIWDLERQVMDLEHDLCLAQQKQRSQQQQHDETRMSWTMKSRDFYVEPAGYGYDEEDNDNDTAMVFGESTMAQLACGTPSRARSSFPTPPATSPMLMSSPIHEQMVTTPLMSLGMVPRGHLPVVNAGVQTSFTDWGRQEEIEMLQLEIGKLNLTLDTYKAFINRLAQNLPRDVAGEGTQANSIGMMERLDGQICILLRALSDRTAALEILTSEISSLGFPGDDASTMLQSVTASLRIARLELEYLTPGEIDLPLTSHGAEVLDLLLDRLRELAKKVKEGDDAIDEYHSIELNLRQQLDARVSAMDGLKVEVAKAEGLITEKTARINELEIGHDRLVRSIDGYVRDLSELEGLVERMDEESKTKATTSETQAATIADLEVRLAVATQKAVELADEFEASQSSLKKQLADVNRRSGDALALRDARVAELRGEVERVNNALREAHEIIHALRINNGKGEGESKRLKGAVEKMKGELRRMLRMSEEFLETETSPL